MYDKGCNYETKKNIPLMLHYFKTAAKKGCTKSMNKLGHFYADINPELMIKYYT